MAKKNIYIFTFIPITRMQNGEMSIYRMQQGSVITTILGAVMLPSIAVFITAFYTAL